MKVQSNAYTLIYSAIVVLIVATCLAVFATALKPAQLKNIEIEKKQNILASVRIASDKTNVEDQYNRYIIDSYTLNTSGEKIQGIDPFLINLREELKKPLSERNLPAYICSRNDSAFLVIPVYGKGLWGPIWGYVSFMKKDSVAEGMPYYNTIYGVNFDHQGETPGLGAEITQSFFQIPFRGKAIFNEQGNFVSIKVIKGGADPGSGHEVDGISGGTITSKGLQAMLDTCLVAYEHYFKSAN
ncbi:MAG: NADH:ubiquinone reductase (Na(+)-transporting) subunit C [Bacteroidales bacterium]|nr:NADH:ubiquinone reductase (Na(+)-transporting) subunit C [Bacteroidales bacterium]